MNPIFRYFWFFGGAFWLVMVLRWRRPLMEIVQAGRLQRDEANAFIQGAAIVIPAVCFALGGISLWAGYSDPTCAKPFSFADAPTAAYNMVVFASWAALWLWVCKGPGADLLARIGAGLPNSPAILRQLSARSVRRAITLFLLLSAAGAFVGSRFGRTSPSCTGLVLGNTALESTATELDHSRASRGRG